MHQDNKPVGYRRNGKPIFPIRGGSTPPGDPTLQTLQPPPNYTIPVLQPTPPPPSVVTIDPAVIARIQADAVAAAQAQMVEERQAQDARMAALQQEVATLTQTADQQRSSVETAARAEAEAAEAARVAALTEQQRLAEGQNSLAQQIADLQEQNARQAALLVREREFADLSAYRQQKLTENVDSIMPSLTDFVAGNSREEIDASIALVQRKTAETFESVRQANVQRQIQQPHAAPSGIPPVGGPMEQIDGRLDLSAADIDAMNMTEYAKFRPQLLPAAAQAGSQGRGLFG